MCTDEGIYIEFLSYGFITPAFRQLIRDFMRLSWRRDDFCRAVRDVFIPSFTVYELAAEVYGLF